MLFIPVTNITNVPATAIVGIPLKLTGTVIPDNANNQIITWSLIDAGTTGATITDNVFLSKATGIAVIMATIVDGTAIGIEYTQEFIITNMLDIDDIILPQVVIYPNPTNSEFRVRSSEFRVWNSEFKVFDIMGKEQQIEYKIENEELIINISHLYSGIYYLQINNKAFKIIKS
jgi:hypothetical protein